MKKLRLAVILVLCILMQTFVCSADYYDDYTEGGVKYCPPIDLSVLPEDIDIDALTTTSINPWMKQFHLTTLEQALIGYRGGECGQKCFTLTAAPTNPDLLLLGTDTETVWRSEDGGLSWRPSDEGLALAGTHFMCFSPDDENIAFVTSLSNEGNAPTVAETGLYKSTDAGKTWYQVLNLDYQTRVFSNSMVSFSDVRKDGKRDVYTCGNRGGVFMSDDNGDTWRNIGLKDYYIHSVDAVDKSVVVCTKEHGIVITDNDGASWREINTGIDSAEVRAIAVDPRDKNHWVAVTAKNLFETKDFGKNWTMLNTVAGIFSKDSYNLWRANYSAIREDGTCRLYVTSSSVQNPMHYSDDDGKTFVKPKCLNDTAFIKDNWGWSAEPYYSHPADPNLFWISLDGQIMKSTDGGATLFPSSSGYSGMRAANFLFDINGDENYFYIAHIDRSSIKSAYSGRGENYPLMNNMPNEDRYPNLRTDGSKTSKSVAVDPKNPLRVLDNRGAWNDKAVIKESLDGGDNWHDIEGTFGIDTRFLKFNPDNPNTIYAGNMISYDDGVTWQKTPMKMYAMSPFDGNVVYAVLSGVVYKSTDEGRTFSPMCTGVPTSLQRMTPDKFKPDKLYLGTTTSGVCIVDGATCSIKDDKNGLIRVHGRVPIYCIAQDPENELHLVAGGTYALTNYKTAGLFESYDGGESWKHIPGVLNTKDIWVIEFRASKKQVWIGTSGGTYVYEYENFFEPTDTLYTDIDDSYARSEIISLYNTGFYDEFTDGHFKPKGTTSREDFSKLLAKFLDARRNTNAEPFKDVVQNDVSKGGYYYPYIEALYESGIIGGSEDGIFDPKAPLTYDQLVIIGSRILSAKHIQCNVSLTESNTYTDIPLYSRYAYARCLEKGILDDKISFMTGEPATNEDIAHFIYNLKKVLD